MKNDHKMEPSPLGLGEPGKRQGSDRTDSGDNSVGKSALVMSFGTMSSRVLGLVRESLLAAFFDLKITDAWIVAFRIPNLFRRLLGEGSLSMSFLPMLVSAQTQSDGYTEAHNGDGRLRARSPSPRAQDLINGFYTLLVIILTVITLSGILFPEIYLNIFLDPSFRNSQEKFEMTIRMAQIMFGFIFFISQYAFYMAILNSLGKFGWAALSPLFFNIAMIISTLIPQQFFSRQGDGLAWGVLLGGFLQAAVLWPQLQKLKHTPKIVVKFWNADVARAFKGFLPAILGMSLVQVTLIVNTRFASSLAEGSISYIHWSDRILELPLSLISVSLGTALLPTLSSLWSRKQKDEFSKTGLYYLKLNIFLSMACAVGLLVLSQPIVEILFQRGKFGSEDTLIATQVLFVYGLSIIPTSCIRILGPFYYAAHNTWLPAIVSAVALIFHVLLAPYLMKHFGLFGLNFSTFLSASFNMLVLFAFLKRFSVQLDLRDLLSSFLRYLFIFMVFGIGLSSYWILRKFINGSSSPSFILNLVLFSGSITLGLLLLHICAHFMKLHEYHQTLGQVYLKIRRKILSH